MEEKIYVYYITNDTGLAPCPEDGLLSLSCCKSGKRGGMRKSIGDSLWYRGYEDV